MLCAQFCKYILQRVEYLFRTTCIDGPAHIPFYSSYTMAQAKKKERADYKADFLVNGVRCVGKSDCEDSCDICYEPFASCINDMHSIPPSRGDSCTIYQVARGILAAAHISRPHSIFSRIERRIEELESVTDRRLRWGATLRRPIRGFFRLWSEGMLEFSSSWR